MKELIEELAEKYTTAHFPNQTMAKTAIANALQEYSQRLSETAPKSEGFTDDELYDFWPTQAGVAVGLRAIQYAIIVRVKSGWPKALEEARREQREADAVIVEDSGKGFPFWDARLQLANRIRSTTVPPAVKPEPMWGTCTHIRWSKQDKDWFEIDQREPVPVHKNCNACSICGAPRPKED